MGSDYFSCYFCGKACGGHDYHLKCRKCNNLMCRTCGMKMIVKYGHKDHHPKECDRIYLGGMCKDMDDN